MQRGRPRRNFAQPDLTHRQREVLDLIVQGRTNAEIGERLGISLDGAKWHVSEILTRLGLETREQAAEYWRHERSAARQVAVRGGMLAGFLRVPVLAGIAAATIVGTFALVLLLVRDGDDSPPASAPGTATVAAPTSIATTTPPPASATGRIVVMRRVAIDTGFPTYEVATVDRATGTTVSSFRIGELDDRVVMPPLLIGTQVVAVFDQRVDLYEPNGTLVRRLLVLGGSSGEHIHVAAVHEERGLVAISSSRPISQTAEYPRTGDITFVRAADGTVVEKSNQQDWPGYTGDHMPGYPHGVAWVEDGSGVFVQGATGSERPGARWRVSPDGSVTQVNFTHYVRPSPDGKLLVHYDVPSPWCLSLSAPSFALLDLDTLSPVARVEVPGYNVFADAWEPGGPGLLLGAVPGPKVDGCSENYPPESERAAFLYDITTGATTRLTLAAATALKEEWSGLAEAKRLNLVSGPITEFSVVGFLP